MPWNDNKGGGGGGWPPGGGGRGPWGQGPNNGGGGGRGPNIRPPDLDEVFKMIAGAQQAILFLAFQPGWPSIVNAIAEAQKAKPSLFVRGAVTAPDAAGAFQTAINGDGQTKPPPHRKGEPAKRPMQPPSLKFLRRPQVNDQKPGRFCEAAGA